MDYSLQNKLKIEADFKACQENRPVNVNSLAVLARHKFSYIFCSSFNSKKDEKSTRKFNTITYKSNTKTILLTGTQRYSVQSPAGLDVRKLIFKYISFSKVWDHHFNPQNRHQLPTLNYDSFEPTRVVTLARLPQ